MKELKGQYDFTKKLQWNPAYIEKPGTGPEATFCRGCVHFGHDIEPGEGDNMKHFYFCNKVLTTIGIAKGIDKETASCSSFEQRKRGVVPNTTQVKKK